jgi:hypothetical protein
MSGSVTLNELWTKLQGETAEILPDVTEFNIFSDMKGHSGHWVTWHYEFKLKKTPTCQQGARQGMEEGWQFLKW